ncbi:MAG TPA: PqiC family protein [Steroidobacteraceae bacterium]|nr:PqiC family protein [Steroidobacteraceae bacterium]
MKLPAAAVCFLGLLSACATGRPDHFYILSTLPAGAAGARTEPFAQATLKVTLPSLVDRAEMVLNTSTDGVVILEHERWAAPLSDLVGQALAGDIERRRSDLLVARPGGNGARDPAVRIEVDIVQMTVHRGGHASIEAQWRIQNTRTGVTSTGVRLAGSGEFSAAVGAVDYADVAKALSESLGMLADRLTAQIPHPE